MKMPIVSLNNMAMNESVAATCCFAATNINGHSYETVLSGGYLTDKIGNKITYGVDSSWLNFRGDYAIADEYPVTQMWINSTLGWQYGVQKEDGSFILLANLEKVPAGNMALYEPNLTNCDHKGEYCSYVRSIETTFTKMHIGSTVEHAAAEKWAADHAAIRFNS